MRKRKISECKSDIVFDVVNNLLALVAMLIILYPIIIVVSSSFSDPYALMEGKVWLFPVDASLDGYKAVMHHKGIWKGMYNSLFYTVFGTIVNMIVTILAAYPLSRKDLTVKTHVSLIFAFTMWFSGGLIPTYLLVKNLGLFDSRWAMILPTALSVWNMIILRTYFENSISEELLESAKLDGCDDFRYLWSIAVPLAKPSLAVICLYYMVANWNVFMNAYLYLSDEDLHPIQLVLRQILLQNSSTDNIPKDAFSEGKAQLMSELLKYSTLIVGSLPMIVVYPFVQKYFVKGMMIGAVKG